MELRQRKRIVNALPQYNGGKLFSKESLKGLYSDENIYNFADTINKGFTQKGNFTDKSSTTWNNVADVAGEVLPGQYGQLANNALGLIGNTVGMSKYRVNGNQMAMQTGTTENSIGGIGYTQQNMVDTGAAMSNVSRTATKNTISSAGKGLKTGAIVGSLIPGVGTVIGGAAGAIIGTVAGIFAGNKAKRRQERINNNAMAGTYAQNDQQQAGAMSQALINDWYADNINTTDGVLYANRGKDLKQRKRINKR